MPRTIAPDDIPTPPEAAPNRIRWTVRQCDAIRDAGILTGHYELIDGEIISKMGHNPPHAFTITELIAWLIGLFGAKSVRNQLTINVEAQEDGYDQPEPDIAVTAEPNAAFETRHPGRGDLLMLVEVSDTTLRFDRSTKASLFAQAGIPEYWIVDLRGRQVLVHRKPGEDGYAEITAYGVDDFVSPLERPNDYKLVAELLPSVSRQISGPTD